MRTHQIALVVALLVFGLAAVSTIRPANAEPPSPCFAFGVDVCGTY